MMGGFLKRGLLFAVDLVFLLAVAALTGLYIDASTGLSDPIALLAVIPADAVFVALGLALLGLDRFTHVGLLNRALPFIAILAFTLPLVLATQLSGPGTTWEPGYLLGAAFGVFLVVLTFIVIVTEMITVWRSAS